MARPSDVKVGQLHRYNQSLVAFEHGISPTPKSIILWIGGLSDSLLSVSYPSVLAQNLPSRWSLVEVSLSSSLHGWGTGSIMRDAEELGECVSYFRRVYQTDNKIVVMGHSTGCQDAMQYISGSVARPPVDGVILQAPVSDREALEEGVPENDRKKIIEIAQTYAVRNGQPEQVLPRDLGCGIFGKTPVTAYRWLSLLSPQKDGDDDYFSSDLPDAVLETTFGKFNIPLLILCSGRDEYVPPHVELPGLLEKWSAMVEKGGGRVDRENGGIIEGATHNLEQNTDEVVLDLCQRVQGFLGKIDTGI
jgi:pimeloyl-ACP methyl ester carboxylesterase